MPDEKKELVRLLKRSIVALLDIASHYTLEIPSLQPEFFRGQVREVMDLYRRRITSEDEEFLFRRVRELVAAQRKMEQLFLDKKEAELKDIISTLGNQLKEAAKEDEEFGLQLSRSIEDLRGAADLDDIQEIRRRIKDGMDRISDHITTKREHDRGRIHDLRQQIRGLHLKLDTAKMESMTDALTGIYNRGAFDQQIVSEVTSAHQLGRTVSVAMVDIDHFKRVNDTYGHQAGDMVLADVAQLLVREFFRKSDIVARYGGEEFIAILVHAKLEDAHRLSERLLKAIAEREIKYDDQIIRLTASVGVAQLLPNETADALVRRADQALYQAKELGRDRVVEAPYPDVVEAHHQDKEEK